MWRRGGPFDSSSRNKRWLRGARTVERLSGRVLVLRGYIGAGFTIR